MSIICRRGYVYIGRPIDNVDRAAAEGKERKTFKIFAQNRPKAKYVRSGILGSGVRKAKALIERLGL